MTTTVPAWAIALAVIVAAALAALVTALLLARQQRLRGELADARHRLRAFDGLLGDEGWETDREHRLRPRASESIAEHPLLWAGFAEPAAEQIAALMARQAPLDDIPVLAADGDGRNRRLVVRGRSVGDAAGRFIGYVGTLRPAPEETTATDAETAPADAEASAAVSEHESFGYTVSHDLRAPIRIVEGFTRIVKEDYGRVIDRVGHDHLDRVLGAATRMNNMIDALLALSRLSSQPIARVPVDLSQLAAWVVDDLRRQSPERRVACEIEPGLLVIGDPTLLRMVLENLIGNAWKYTTHVADAEIAFLRHEDEANAFTVRDNGAGFDMRFADRLFGVFQRLHSASEFPGTGIGLASVRRIVRRHGGEIRAEAEPDRGARFHFSLSPDGGR